MRISTAGSARKPHPFTVPPYALLGIGVIITLLQPVRQVPVLTLSITAALGLLWFHTLHPEWHRNRPLMGLYYTGLMVLAAAMVTAVGYLDGVARVTADNLWWAWLGVGVVSTVLAWSMAYSVEMADHRDNKRK